MNKKVFVVGALLMFSGAAMAQEQSTQNIQEVTLASKMPQDITKTGKNVTLLTAKDLEKFKGQNLTDVLDQVVGFQISGNFNNTAEPKSLKVRGGTDRNVVVLVDGVPMRNVTGNDFSVEDLRLFALENVESIEVLNGSSSVLYGANATVSVINIHTKKAGSKVIEGNASVRGGSFDTFAQNASVRGRAGKINYAVNGFNEKSSGISAASGDSTFDKDGWEKQNVDATVGYSDDKFDINVNGGWKHNLYRYDTGAFVDGLQRGNDNQYFGGLNAGYKYNNGHLVFTSRYAEIDRIGQDYVKRAYQDQFSFKGRNLITELYNNYTVNKYFNFTVGGQYETQNMDASSLPYGGNAMELVTSRKDAKMDNLDVYANVNLNYNGFNLDGGARMTHHNRFNNHWVYSVNPYYLGTTGDFYYKVGYSFATAFIAPTLYQSYGSAPWVVGNPDLKPETNQSHEVDLAFGKQDRSLNITASFYYRKEKNSFIDVMDDQTYITKYFNTDHNQVRGADVGFDYKIIDQVRIGGNYSYVHKDNTATRLRQPKTRVNSFIEVKPFLSTSVVLSHQYVSKRDDAFYDVSVGAKKYVVDDSFNLFAVNINQKITKDLSAFFNVGNVFNTSYVDIVGYTTKKRNYTLGFSYNF